MNQKTILFDLDGTLTDSGEGILSCTQEMLRHFHLPVPDKKDMRFMVGPPLKESFPQLGVKPEDISKAIEIYRKHYEVTGIYQNFPYPGIAELLRQLHAQGHILCVATSKPEYMAHIVLKHFDLAQYFHFICGAASDEKRSSKSDVIAYLLQQQVFPKERIMIGDTVYDVEGAAEFGIPTIGVAWGYGNVDDMLSVGAMAIANDTEELFTLLNQ